MHLSLEENGAGVNQRASFAPKSKEAWSIYTKYII
jgi:hypothetical protein